MSNRFDEVQYPVIKNARALTFAESALSLAFRSLPVKHGAHWILDRLCPRPWVRGSPIVAIPYRGAVLEINISDLVGWHFCIMRSFDPEVAETILRFAGDNDVFWDVGANKGTCAYRIAAALPACRIVAIEPQRTMQELLQHNLGILASGRYEIFAVGIGEQAGQFSLFIDMTNQGRATLVGMTDPHRSESVEIATAKTIADRSAFGWPTLVKIDVEGFEISVIRSLADAFRTRAVRCCVFECHPAYERDYEEIKRLLAGCGYYLYAIAKTTLRTSLVPAERLRRGSTDYAIVRDDLRS